MQTLQQNLKLLTLQYELSMLIGLDLNLEKMLSIFLPKTLKYLNCIGGYIWLYSHKTDKLERYFSYPNDIISLSTELLTNIELLSTSGTQKLPENYLYFTDTFSTNNYIFPIAHIGFILLQNKNAFSEQLIAALKPIFSRLAIACSACLQFSQTESKYRNIFENSPISLWEEDISVLKDYLDKLKEQKFDIPTYLDNSAEKIIHCIQLIKIGTVNKTALELFKVKNRKEFEKNYLQIFYQPTNEALQTIKAKIIAIAEGKKNFLYETTCQLSNGDQIDILFKYSTSPGDDNFSKVLISVVDITALKILQAKLEYSALHDSLTGLANRRLFEESLKIAAKRTKRTKQIMALVYADVDNLKIINDRLGHNAGDLLLIEVAKRLQSKTREDDIVARLGGDEFAIILNGLKQPSEAETIAERIKNSFAEAINLDGIDVQTSLSIGISFYPQDSRDTFELNRYADIALYAAKNAGKNAVCLYAAIKRK